MIVSDPQKTLCPEKIPIGGTTRLTISFRAQGELSETDLVLAMDRSGSMGGEPLCRAVQAAISMIDLFLKGSGCCLPDKSRMGLISYADCARMEVPLEACMEPVKEALRHLKAGGNTNHQAAIQLAGEMLTGCRAKRKILILFTDGKSNCGCPEAAAAQLREQGVEIFCIGLGMEACSLKNIASQPWKEHICMAEHTCALETAFLKTAEKIMGSSLKAKLREQVEDDFEITGILPPKVGSVRRLDKKTVLWTLETGAEACHERICLQLEVRHMGCRRGSFPINRCLTYEERDHHCLKFPNPCIRIEEPDCRPEECCRRGCCIVAEPCRDAAVCCCGETKLTGLGRIVEVNAVIRDVCPGKRIGAAIILTEVDLQGKEHNLGMKTYEIPAQKGENCRDVTLNCIQFVVPESTRVWDPCAGICSPRCFRARIIANYLDTDYESCEGICAL